MALPIALGPQTDYSQPLSCIIETHENQVRRELCADDYATLVPAFLGFAVNKADKIIIHFQNHCGLLEAGKVANTKLKNLNLDSLEFMELIMEIEDEFQVSIGDDLIDPDMVVSKFAEMAAK